MRLSVLAKPTLAQVTPVLPYLTCLQTLLLLTFDLGLGKRTKSTFTTQTRVVQMSTTAMTHTQIEIYSLIM